MTHTKYFIVAILNFCSFFVYAQDKSHVSDSVATDIVDRVFEIEKPDSNGLIIVFAGDIMGHDTQIEGAWTDSNNFYNYEPTFRYIKDYISAADIAVANLEVTLAGPPFKGYPQFSSPDELAIAARDAGFDIFITANNHALDRGVKGVERTITMLDSFNIVHTGTFRNTEEREKNYPLIVEKKGIRLALLNYTYGTNGLKVKEPYIVNRIDTAQIRKDIEKAKMAEPDYIICTIHWGVEYERTENAKQRMLTRFILDKGVDAIIGSHPHVIQPVKLENCSESDISAKCPVFYSLGNFVSNQRAQYKDGGIVAELHLSKMDSAVRFDSICYLPYWVYREMVGEKYTFYVVPVAKYENEPSIIDFNDNDLYRFNRFERDTRGHLKGIDESDFYNSLYDVALKSKVEEQVP